jgi:copper(I)-binding protein
MAGGFCAGLLLVGAASAQAVKPPKALPVPAVSASQAQAQAQVKVEGAWVRPAVKGQSATGGYMRLTAYADLKLLGFSSPVAAEAQLHEMVMDGDVMQMREAGPLPLPAGTAVALQPGAGHQHLMLMGLKRPLKVGDEIKLVLKLQSAAGKALTQAVIVPVRSTAPASP